MTSIPFRPSRRIGLLAAVSLTSLSATGGTAWADDQASISSIEKQIGQLRSELAAVRGSLAKRKTEIAHARAAADQARAEAREANQRANGQGLIANGQGQSFSGAPTSGGGFLPVAPGHYPGVFAAQDLPKNGLGPHSAQTAGEQQASALGNYGRFQLGGVSVQLGGFFEALGVERTRNLVSDFASPFQNIPYANSSTYHEPEFRGTARQSRLSLLIEGKPNDTTRVAGYFETDFGSSGVSSNSNESNSYSLRIRQAYATYDRSDWGFHMLAGQAWSLLTLDRVGITPRQENIPLVADGQIHVGFNWARQWQLRFVKDFDNHRLWAGLSFEEPQTVYSVTTANVANVNNVGGVIGGADNFVNTGGSLLNSTANYSADIAPDVIAKLAFDPSFGHYELYGLGRIMNTRDTLTAPAINSGRDRTALAGGVGGGLLLPIIGKSLVFQASGLVGQGIGRYGSGQLPDATINQNGTPIPLPEAQALAGLVYHPAKTIDLFAYVGAEEEEKRSFNERIGGSVYAFGYGNGRLNDTGCETEGGTCAAQTRGLVEGTLGGWWRFAHGTWGTLQAGTSWSYIRKDAFDGTSTATVGRRTVTTTVSPSTDENVILFSFRYLPFL